MILKPYYFLQIYTGIRRGGKCLSIQTKSTILKDITGNGSAVGTISSGFKQRNKNERPGMSSSQATSVRDPKTCGQGQDDIQNDLDQQRDFKTDINSGMAALDINDAASNPGRNFTF